MNEVAEVWLSLNETLNTAMSENNVILAQLHQVICLQDICNDL